MAALILCSAANLYRSSSLITLLIFASAKYFQHSLSWSIFLPCLLHLGMVPYIDRKAMSSAVSSCFQDRTFWSPLQVMMRTSKVFTPWSLRMRGARSAILEATRSLPVFVVPM